ncbi:MAG: hypothetical protein PF630_00245 [Gammaproteobacteria bacterium]|jgi:tetratricopeptide (TPR) repeat protein|nr:hypothetical protein [Gammaproteobacteria bacterium]
MTCNKNALRLVPLTVLLGLLLACGTQQSVPISDRSVNVDAQPRAPVEQYGQGLQIKPLQTPGVQELLAQSALAEQAGDVQEATVLMERAMRLQPGNPEILQRMAELNQAAEHYEQALNYAARSYDLGPKVGELCSRNWHTIALSREHLEDHAGAAEARQRASNCAVQPPARF